MTVEETIKQEVTNSTWQPAFEFTEDLEGVVDDILKPHEDYFLGLHSKVGGIIQREILFRNSEETRHVPIKFADICDWQQELFKHKKEIIAEKKLEATMTGNTVLERKLKLPNLYINMGLRDKEVSIGRDGWELYSSDNFSIWFNDYESLQDFLTKDEKDFPNSKNSFKKHNIYYPPIPIVLENLKKLCFPISLESKGSTIIVDSMLRESTTEEEIKNHLTNWYKTFQTIHFLNDLNGRVGGIVINILSYLLTGKYLIKKNESSFE